MLTETVWKSEDEETDIDEERCLVLFSPRPLWRGEEGGAEDLLYYSNPW